MRRLLMTLDSSLPRKDAEFIAELVDANESGVALQVLSNVLLDVDARLEQATIDEIASLVQTMGLDSNVSEQLRGLVVS